MIFSSRLLGICVALTACIPVPCLQSCCLSATTAQAGALENGAWHVIASTDVTRDGRIGQLVAYNDCGTQGCTFELRIGQPPHQTALFQTVAKDCSILKTRSAGYSDIECIQLQWVQEPGFSWVRVTNRYRWHGASYASPLDHLNDGVKPAMPPPCKAARITQSADVLILPAPGVRVSAPRPGGGWRTGPARTPVIGHLRRGAIVPLLEQVTSARTGVWLLVRLGEQSSGWVRGPQTQCVGEAAE